MKKYLFLFAASVLLTACQDENIKLEQAVEESKIQVAASPAETSLKVIAFRVFCSGNVVDLDAKEKTQCKESRVKQQFNIFDSNRNLIKKFETSNDEAVTLILPAGEYYVSNVATPVMERQETKFILKQGQQKELNLKVSVTLPQSQPLLR
ncbi:hypothetical protein [Pseudoalteromonas denitrificans]|uniref:Lipoprotein n=1 Tax=Pseudoalteromonas denitrificans DSM 6059 TaxID=1123010 RepID=A0A1I1MYK0_9GAMM|nr:hypothetical protein [Pseudoalteromonas denitrificans]SFC90176.1 hypothetical protein SAMN02745724_02869 [Pseudoalteromonas denitrificans DSM 6059]